MASTGEVREVLEAIALIDPERRGAKLNDIAAKLCWPIGKTLEMLQEGLAKGLLVQQNSLFKLTEKGAEEILAHRAQYIQDNLLHRSKLRTLLERFRRRSGEDVEDRLRSARGLDGETSSVLQDNLQASRSRVEEVVPLTSLKHGESGEVVLVVAGRGLLARLAAMGLTPKVRVRVVRSAPLHGPIEVSLRGISVILGYGVASKIYVRRLADAK